MTKVFSNKNCIYFIIRQQQFSKVSSEKLSNFNWRLWVNRETTWAQFFRLKSAIKKVYSAIRPHLFFTDIEKHKLKLKSTSWNSNPRVTSSNPRVTSSNSRTRNYCENYFPWLIFVPKYDFNRVVKQFWWGHTKVRVFCEFAVYFQAPHCRRI